MIFDKSWEEMTEEEKMKVIDPLLNSLKTIMLSDKSLSLSYSADYGETPDIRDGIGKRISAPFPVTDVFTIEITRIKNT